MVEENGDRIANLDNALDALSPAISNGHPQYVDAGDLLDEGRSSSLSDLEDGADEVDMVSAISVLSRQIEADSEAETERLEISPKKLQNHKDVEIGMATYKKSPSKLVQSAVPQAGEQEPFSDSIVSSPGPSDEDLESEMRSEHSAASDNEDNIDRQIRASSPRKRKRLDMEDDSGSADDADEARRQRRRTQSVRSDIEEQSELGVSREATIEPIGVAPEDQNAFEVTSNVIRDAQNILKSKSSKAARVKHGKVKGRESLKNIVEEREGPDTIAASGANETRPGTDDEERGEGEGEDEDVEAAARDEEEYAKKMSAMDSLAALEKHFAALRDRLYDERIVALNDELAQLSATKPSHPEFLRQLDCIRKFRDEKFDTEKKLLVYKIKSLKTKSVAQRSQIHSAYFQTVRDVREKHLDRIGERLSRVRRDHVKADEKVPNYSIPFPTRRSTQITQQTSYNKEVSVLSGIAKFVGFPAAPNVSSAFQAEMDEDMERMGISLNNVRNNKPIQSRLSRSAFLSVMAGPAAEEQFLEQNPWANPQHPIHQQHLGRLSRQVSDQTQVADVSITPITQKSLVDLNKPAGSASTIPEHLSAQASSALATPYSSNEGLREKTSELIPNTSDQQLPQYLDKAEQQKDRLQSLSPSETRKHNLIPYEPRSNKPDTSSGTGTGIEEASSRPYKPSRITMFGSPSRPDSIPRNGTSNADIVAPHTTSSPITLHQHARENNLTPTTGLSRIGAR